MIPPEAPASRNNLQRDVQPRPRLATLTCPNCLGTLQVQADVRAEAPCPICRHPLRYVPPESRKPQPFVARQRIDPQPAPTPAAPPRTAPTPVATPEPAPAEPAPEPRASLRSLLRRGDDFLNTPTGTSIAWVVVALLVTACVILFFHWDQDRRERTLRMESIESTRPPASHRPSTSSVPLLPGEPAPVDTFGLPE